MRITSKMFNDNPGMDIKDIMEKISKERHKSNKQMPSREERQAERIIKKLEKS